MTENLAERLSSIDIVERIKSGDKQAESELVTRYKRGLLFMLMKNSGDAERANDISQETWRIVIEKIRSDELRDSSKLTSYILQVGKNQLLMSYRGMKHREHGDMDFSKLESENTSPSDDYERMQEKKLVNRVLEEMSKPRDRQILRRVYLFEEDKETVCDALSVGDADYYRILSRARQKFKELWLKRSPK